MAKQNVLYEILGVMRMANPFMKHDKFWQENWTGWICHACLKKLPFVYSINCHKIRSNGVVGDPMKHGCGLRQGDSLSPLLFVLAIDPLHHLLNKATSQGTSTLLVEEHRPSGRLYTQTMLPSLSHPRERTSNFLLPPWPLSEKWPAWLLTVLKVWWLPSGVTT